MLKTSSQGNTTTGGFPLHHLFPGVLLAAYFKNNLELITAGTGRRCFSPNNEALLLLVGRKGFVSQLRPTWIQTAPLPACPRTLLSTPVQQRKTHPSAAGSSPHPETGLFLTTRIPFLATVKISGCSCHTVVTLFDYAAFTFSLILSL